MEIPDSLYISLHQDSHQKEGPIVKPVKISFLHRPKDILKIFIINASLGKDLKGECYCNSDNFSLNVLQ